MDGIASVISVGAVASQFQAPTAPSDSAPPAKDVGTNALRLIQALIGSVETEEHVLDLKG